MVVGEKEAGWLMERVEQSGQKEASLLIYLEEQCKWRGTLPSLVVNIGRSDPGVGEGGEAWHLGRRVPSGNYDIEEDPEFLGVI